MSKRPVYLSAELLRLPVFRRLVMRMIVLRHIDTQRLRADEGKLYFEGAAGEGYAPSQELPYYLVNPEIMSACQR